MMVIGILNLGVLLVLLAVLPNFVSFRLSAQDGLPAMPAGTDWRAAQLYTMAASMARAARKGGRIASYAALGVALGNVGLALLLWWRSRGPDTEAG